MKWTMQPVYVRFPCSLDPNDVHEHGVIADFSECLAESIEDWLYEWESAT